MHEKTRKHWKYGTKIPLKLPRWTQEEDKELLEAYSFGKRGVALAKATGRSYAGVKHRVIKLIKHKIKE